MFGPNRFKLGPFNANCDGGLSECMVDLKRATGLSASRHGWFNAASKRKRVAQVMKFYGLDHLDNGAG